MRRSALLCILIVALGAARAEAVTVREIVELSKSGLSDDVLLALIDIESKVFPVDPDTVRMLKDGGVSERVIAAIIRHGRSKPLEPLPVAAVAPQPSLPPEPQVIVIDHHDEAPVQSVREVREVPVAVPVYFPIYVRQPRHGGNVAPQAPIFAPGVPVGLPHSRIGLSAPPPKPTSDPPYWQKSPYLK